VYLKVGGAGKEETALYIHLKGDEGGGPYGLSQTKIRGRGEGDTLKGTSKNAGPS